MNELAKFRDFVNANIENIGNDEAFSELSLEWMRRATELKYSYNFRWMGRPIIQFPQDLIAMQEIIWEVKPDLIIETGIAHGGSLIYYASLLELIGSDGYVLGIDIDIRAHNRTEIENHPMSKRIKMIEGSSVDINTIQRVKDHSEGKRSVLVILDSNHTHSHVLKELEAYSPLVTKGNYLVVFDTVIEDLPDDLFTDRPWKKGDNGKTAVRKFLKDNKRFEIDKSIENKLLITVAPNGYLRCVGD